MEEEPMSAEEFTRRHPGLVSAIECAVRKDLEFYLANGVNSANVQCPFDGCKIPSNSPLVLSDTQDCISKCGNCLIRVPCSSEKLRVLRGIDRLSVHALTSLLMAGGFILASLAIVGKLNKKQYPTD